MLWAPKKEEMAALRKLYMCQEFEDSLKCHRNITKQN